METDYFKVREEINHRDTENTEVHGELENPAPCFSVLSVSPRLKTIEMKATRVIWIVLFFSGCLRTLSGQDFKFNPRYSYYTNENRAEMLLVAQDAESPQALAVQIILDNRTVYQADTVTEDRLLRIPISLVGVDTGNHPLTARITVAGKTTELQSVLVKLLPKSNGVQIDRLTGKLIVNGLPWFPFGFYCYSPVPATLAEEEAVKGFNLMSPYQSIDPRTIRDREIYMDRCARLGMRVHYQLISMAGGGGVGSSRSAGLTREQKMGRLKAEVEHFRDHPALLAWYLSDEPTGNGIGPDTLQKMYDFVRRLDPWHPITIVFDAPQRAREYAASMDIVMADPYPIPNAGVDGVGSVTESLRKVFEFEKPVWIVPQAFGGGEWWGREPSPQEIRAMTYLALVRGATGIQYFIRQGLNGFPKSTVTWGECSKVAMEMAGITPYLLDGTPLPEMMQEKDGIWTNGWQLGNEILAIAVNANSEPQQFILKLPDIEDVATCEVMFENRRVTLADQRIADWIGPLGAQIYRIGPVAEDTKERNLISDPGFESNLSYGVPASCYARVGSDRGATAFLDSRTRVSGHQSLRLVTPEYRKGMGLSFFPVSLNSGQSYRFSIRAKADSTTWLPGKKPSFLQRLLGKNAPETRDFMVKIGNLADHSFTPVPEWLSYSFYFTVPVNSDGQVKVNPYLELTGQGTAWFDEMVLAADPVISYAVDREKRRSEITLSSGSPDVIIRYNPEGRKPRVSDPEYRTPVAADKTISMAAGIFRNDQLLSWTVQTFKVHLAVGHVPVYEKKYAVQYSAGGSLGLVDGQSGSRNYSDGKWQGFNGQDLAVVIDLDSIQSVRKVSLGFLQDIASWIFMPLKVEVEGSADGENYKLLGYSDNQVDEHARGSIRKDFVVEFGEEPLRFIRIKASNRKICPEWHNGKGKAAFIFADEISVE